MWSGKRVKLFWGLELTSIFGLVLYSSPRRMHFGEWSHEITVFDDDNVMSISPMFVAVGSRGIVRGGPPAPELQLEVELTFLDDTEWARGRWASSLRRRRRSRQRCTAGRSVCPFEPVSKTI